MSAFRRRLMGMQRKRKPAYGVYIQAVDGKLYTVDNWDSSLEENGIAVVDEKCSLVLMQLPGSECQWSKNGQLIEGIYTNASQAKSDFGGKLNTQKIVEQIGDGYYYAAKSCYDYVFPNGKRGYLPACGEMDVIFSHKDEINAAIKVIGGNYLSGKYWTSSQVNSSAAFTADEWGYRGGEGKTKEFKVLIVSEL